MRFLGANCDEPDWIPFWPPDAFALSGSYLRRTGAYISLVNGTQRRQWAAVATERPPVAVGMEWRDTLKRLLGKPAPNERLRDACPPEIGNWWRAFGGSADQPLLQTAMYPEVVESACKLVVASDAACRGIGLDLDDDPFLAFAQAILDHNRKRSFCRLITPEKVAVLGKQHTPQRGCTIRSLTHNLALYTPTEIGAYWSGPYRPATGDFDVFNLLLLPWPTDVRGSDFRVARRGRNVVPAPDTPPADAHRYFEFEPPQTESPSGIAKRVRSALKHAQRHADQIHAIVFPELALTKAQFDAIERVAVANRTMLISGVRYNANETGVGKPANVCAIQPLGLTSVPHAQLQRHSRVWDETRRFQLKHHRWCLDRNQILQYELGGRLPASRECWEHIFIGDRTVNFVTLGAWLTLCVLICEDLARQDPVAEVIRAVGPNIVFALLMDGPQLRSRWPSRYASVLAEDPGSSVLTLTSLGMAKRSRPREDDRAVATDKSHVIGLWRDAIYGEREIGLQVGHDACVLSLVCRTTREYTIDGRSDDDSAHFPVFAGSHSFSTGARRRGDV
jgi:hypothetical protein